MLCGGGSESSHVLLPPAPSPRQPASAIPGRERGDAPAAGSTKREGISGPCMYVFDAPKAVINRAHGQCVAVAVVGRWPLAARSTEHGRAEGGVRCEIRDTRFLTSNY
jgi:hypothetical protein